MLHSYDYAIIRITPDLERGECLNVGVVLYCRTKRFLVALTYLDAPRLAALAAACDTETLGQQLALFGAIARGDRDAGPIAALPAPERFHWLVAPRSTVLAAGPVHCGLAVDPAQAAQQLYERLVL
jgi:hypothetical protein